MYVQTINGKDNLYQKIYLKNKKIYMKKRVEIIMKSANKSKSQNDNAIFINIKNPISRFFYLI